MSEPEYLTFAQLAQELDMPETSTRRAWRSLSGFPKPIQKGKQKLVFLRADVLAWTKGRDVKTLILAANATGALAKKTALKAEPPKPFDVLAKQFMSGRFLPTEQKQKIEFKKMVARHNKPLTHRQRLVFAWMLDDKQCKSRITHG